MSTIVDFEWTTCEDPDGDAISYKLYYDTDPSFTANPSIIAQSSPEISKIHYAGVGSLIGLFFAIAMISDKKGRKKIFMLGLILVITSTLLGSCGGNDNPATTQPISGTNVVKTVTGLDPSSTYYWKVVADDGQGGVSESDTFTFQTL